VDIILFVQSDTLNQSSEFTPKPGPKSADTEPSVSPRPIPWHEEPERSLWMVESTTTTTKNRYQIRPKQCQHDQLCTSDMLIVYFNAFFIFCGHKKER